MLANSVPTADAAYESIAVLPFVNMTGDAEVEYLGDGTAEELRNALEGIGGISVPSVTSAAAFKGGGADIRAIGDSLDVELVLEGSVRGTSDRLRVTAQLLEAKSGYHVWQQSYDRPVADLLDLQDEQTGLIVDALVFASPEFVAVEPARPSAEMRTFTSSDVRLRELVSSGER